MVRQSITGGRGMKQRFLLIFLCAGMVLASGAARAQDLTYDQQLFRAQLELKKACQKYDHDKAVFDRIEVKRLANKKLQDDLREKIREAGREKRSALFDLMADRSVVGEEYDRRTAQVREKANNEMARLETERMAALRIEWSEFGEPYRAVREKFVIKQIVKENAQEALKKIKENKPGQNIVIDGGSRQAGPGDDPELDEAFRKLFEDIKELARHQDPASPHYVSSQTFQDLEIALDRSVVRTQEQVEAFEEFLNSDLSDLLDDPADSFEATGPGAVPDPTRGPVYPNRGPASDEIDDIARDVFFSNPDISPEIVGLYDNTITFGVDIEGGLEILGLPDYDLGVTSLGTDTSPLHRFDDTLFGPAFEVGIDYTRPGPDGSLFARISGGFAALERDDNQTIPGFAVGQAPTYIDITGGGGFAFNNNSIVGEKTDVTRYGLKGEAGFEKSLGPRLAAIPYMGAYLRRTEIGHNVTMDTDFLGGRFFNTLDERMDLNQLGIDVGFDLKYQPTDRLLLTFGGHAGLAYTDTSYSGSDCGDGSTATPGCDGALFSNTGVSRGRSSVDPFGGLKAAVGFYFFCRANATQIAAGLITAAAGALKNHCAEVSAQARYEATPTSRIVRPTALGPTGVQLGADYMHSGAFSLRFRLPLNP